MSDYEKTRRITDQVENVQKIRLVRSPDAGAAYPNAAAPQQAAGAVPKTTLVRPEAAAPSEQAMPSPHADRYIAGWVVVTAGPAVGKFAPIYDGMNSIGRNADQDTCLNFGDEAISRSEHGHFTYDNVERKFYINHAGKANIIRLNGKAVLQATEIVRGDKIDIGKTTLRFVPFCDGDFNWPDVL